MLSTAVPVRSTQPGLALSRGLSESDPLQVLILDDERFDRHRLARMCSGLAVPIDVTNAPTLSVFKDQLEQRAYDLILLDYLLPDGTGIDAMSAVRLSPANLNAATIMITGQGQENLAAEAMSVGCADYLTKDNLTDNAFRRAVTNALQKSDLTLQVEAQNFARGEVEKVLEHFAASFARDIKPMVSRMLRQMRDLRGAERSPEFTALDATCISMWEALVSLERNTGPEMMARALTSDPKKMLKRSPPRQPSKPPSPFSRVNH